MILYPNLKSNRHLRHAELFCQPKRTVIKQCHVGAEMRSILFKNNAKCTSTPYFANFSAVRVGCVPRTVILFNCRCELCREND